MKYKLLNGTRILCLPITGISGIQI